jgi:hypothetical protein
MGELYPIPATGFAKRMQCCNNAEYHTDFEICCDFNSSRPAPFLKNLGEAKLHKSQFYVRSVASRTTKTRVHADAPAAHQSTWIGNFGSQVALSFNHWGTSDGPAQAFPYQTDRCAPTAGSSSPGNVE